jgi:hypothetical protein
MRTLITNGTIVTGDGSYDADVLIDGETIAQLGRDLAAGGVQADETINASGKYVIPGGIDVHTHLDMPFGGTTSADDFETGTIAAAHGGTTTLIDFAIQSFGEGLYPAFDGWMKKAEGKSVIDYAFHMIVRELSDLLEVSQTLGSTLNLKASLTRILEVLEASRGTLSGAVFLKDDDAGDLVVEAATGAAASVAKNARYRMGEGITGRVVVVIGGPSNQFEYVPLQDGLWVDDFSDRFEIATGFARFNRLDRDANQRHALIRYPADRGHRPRCHAPVKPVAGCFVPRTLQRLQGHRAAPLRHQPVSPQLPFQEHHRRRIVAPDPILGAPVRTGAPINIELPGIEIQAGDAVCVAAARGMRVGRQAPAREFAHLRGTFRRHQELHLEGKRSIFSAVQDLGQ